MPILVAGLGIPLVISGMYFFMSSESVLHKRLLSASHGAFLVLSMAYALIAAHWSTFNTWYVYIWPFWILLTAFLIATGYSLFFFKGTKLVHLMHLLQLPLAFWYWLGGTMAITHDSI
jgi:hypothetical protein